MHVNVYIYLSLSLSVTFVHICTCIFSVHWLKSVCVARAPGWTPVPTTARVAASAAWGTPAAVAAASPTASVRTTGQGRPAMLPTVRRTVGRRTGGAARTRVVSARLDGKVGQVSKGSFVWLYPNCPIWKWHWRSSHELTPAIHHRFFSEVRHVILWITNWRPSDDCSLKLQRSQLLLPVLDSVPNVLLPCWF